MHWPNCWNKLAAKGKMCPCCDTPIPEDVLVTQNHNSSDGGYNKLDYTAWFCGHWHIDKRIDKMHFLMHSVEAL